MSSKKSNNEIKCVVSYSHSDEKLVNKFLDHLKAISRTHPLHIWTDRRIKAGENIDANIEKHFREAEIVFILVSCSYIKSDYCYEKELEIAYRRHNASKCVIVPVILSEVATINELPFHNINRVPQDGKAIRSFHSHEKGLIKADEMIIDLLKDFKIDNTNSQIDLSKFTNHKSKSNKMPLNKPQKNDKTSSEKESTTVPTYTIVNEGIVVDKEITQDIILAMPDYFDGTYKFNEFANKVIDEKFIDYKNEFDKKHNLSTNNMNKLRLKLFRGFLFEIANAIQRFYVGDVNSRVHFRRLNGNQYEGIVVSGNKNIISSAKELTTMPAQSGMIFKSGDLSMPLLRSFNKTIHTAGKNDSVWVEHLTCTFKSISNAKTPIISMGISLNEHVVDNYTPILILMAYTRLDNKIGELIYQYMLNCKSIDKDYEITDFINSKF